MPTEEQIRRWEVLEFVAKRDDEHNYLVNRIPLDTEHQEWLQSRARDTTRSDGAFINENSFETLECLSLANESAPTGEVDWTRASPTANNKILSENKYSYINIHATSGGKWYGAIATLDTGSDENWISEDVVDRLGLDVTKGLVTKWKTFNGETVASDSTVRVIWCNSGSGISYANVFRIIPNAPYDVLIGRNLLLSREVAFLAENLKTGAILTIVGPTKKPGEGIAEQVKGRQVDAVHDKHKQKYEDIKDDSPNFSEGHFGKQGETHQLKEHQEGAHHGQGQHDAPANDSNGKGKEKK